jgi:hypothetical protein
VRRYVVVEWMDVTVSARFACSITENPVARSLRIPFASDRA